MAYVDDLLVACPPSELEWVQGEIKKIFEIKGEMLKHGGMVKFLGREIRLTQDGFTWASDPKHAQLLIDELGLHEANDTDVPLGPEDRPEMDATKEPMSVNEAKFYRRCAARLNYMALDRPDLCVAANLLCRAMANTKKGDEKLIKRVCRYLRRHPACVIQYKWQSLPGTVVVRTDSDSAGCRVTRRSTSGLAVFLGEHLLYFASRFQKSVALSSGEAELGAQVAGVAECLSLQKLCAELGLHLSLHSLCDSSAARGIMNRSGTGRMKHLEVKHLWVQELVAKKLLTVQWVPRQQNAADVLTHSTCRSEFNRLLRLLSVSFPDKTSIDSLSESGCWNVQTPMRRCQVAHGGALSNPVTLEDSAMNQCVFAFPEFFEATACASLWESPIPMAMTASS